MHARRLAGSRRLLAAVPVPLILASLLVAAAAGPAAANINTGATAADLAAAVDAQTPSVVSGASFFSKPPSGTPDAVSDTPLAGFPTDGPSYAILTTGDATLAAQANTSSSSGASDNGGHRPGESTANPTDYDVSILKADLNVPVGVNCLRLDFRFLSEEFPEYVNSAYNDGFIAELDASTWSTDGSSISAPNNFAFDPDHNVISINSTGFAHMTAAEAAGTTYDGATPMLVAQTPITPGAHSLYLSIFDQGDQAYDSAAFVDNLVLGVQAPGACEKGAQPLSGLSLSASPSSVPAGFSALPTSSLDYGSLAGASGSGSSSLAVSPIGHSPIGHSPIGHSPIGHSPIGHSPILGQDTAFRTAPLSALPLSQVPPILIASVPIATPPGPWSAVLPPSLAALPFQAVTLQQFAATSAASAVHVGDLDLGDTALAGLSPAALLFSNATLGQLGVTPPTGFGSSSTLPAVQLGGGSLASLGLPALTLVDRAGALGGTMLGAMNVDQVNWADAPAWNLALSAIPASERGSIVDCAYAPCATPGSATLADVATTGDLSQTATLSTLLGLSNASTLLAGKTFGQLLPGIVNVDNFPFETTPLSSILAAAPLDPASQVTYTAGADVPCPVAGTALAVSLPNSTFRYAPGSSAFQNGGAVTPTPAADPAIAGTTLTWSVPSDGCAAGDEHVQLTFAAQPGPNLGTFSASLVVTPPAGDPLSVLDQAPVTTTDPYPSTDPGSAPTVAPGNLYTDALTGPAGLDYLRLPVSSEDVGRQVRVSLSHLPGQDYDLVLYGGANATSLRGAPIGHSPIGHSPIGHSPIGDDQACVPAGTVLNPMTMQDVPQSAGDTFAVRSYSTNRSTETEFACTTVQPEDVGTGILIQVSGYNGATSQTAALLSVQESEAVTLPGCVSVPSTAGNPGPALPVAGTLPTDTQTLFLVNSEGIGRFYGASAESSVTAALTDPAFLGMPNVKGVVLSVDRSPSVSAAVSSWYGDFCSPAAANGVVRAVNDLVDSYRNAGSGLPNLRNIVLVGADPVMPFGRSLEQVTLGTERTEAANLQFGGLDNPTSRALAMGYFLTDDPYYSFQPVPWTGTDLYPPSVAGGRLVETPADIVNAINQYKQFAGRLDPTTEFTTAYDFFTDLGQGQDAVLHGRFAYPKTGPTSFPSQVNENWTKTNLAGGLNALSGIGAINAHADQYRFLPAATFHAASATASDLYTTADFVSSSVAAGSLLLSMGCHAGLSVPDVWVNGADPAALDWAQATAQRSGQFDGNTGFGYGDSKTLAYSEKLTLQLATNLDGTMSVGQAVAYAKQQYYQSLGSWGVFDQKTVEQFTPYGLPMYVLGASGQVAAPLDPVSPPALSTDADTGLQTASLSFASLNSGAVDTGQGVFYKGPSGKVQTEQYRPIEPVTAPQDLTQPASSGLRLHGALMLAFTKTDIAPFAPALSVPTLAPASAQPPPAIDDVSFPSGFTSTLAQDTVFGHRDTLVVYGGQYVSDPGGGPTGTQRLFSNATVRAYYSSSPDTTVAVIRSVNGQDDGASAAFTMATEATDVAAAYVTYRLATTSQFVSQKMAFDQPSGLWKATVGTSQNKVAEYFVQLVTTAGGTSVSQFKQFSYGAPTPPPAQPGSVQITVKDASGNVVSPSEHGWYNRSPLSVSITSGTETFTTTLDGQPASNPVTVSGDGSHDVAYEGSAGTPGHVDVLIDTQAPTLGSCPATTLYSLNAGGGSQTVSVTNGTSDQGPSGLDAADSTLSATLDTSTVGAKSLTFVAKDFAGNATSKTCQFSVQYKFNGFSAPVNNVPTVNSAKAGQSIPVKWQITDANGVGISDPASFLSLTVSNTGTCTGLSDAIETYTGASGLQYLGNGNWQYNWATPKSYAGGCKTMFLNLKDVPTPTAGGPRTAYFKFK